MIWSSSNRARERWKLCSLALLVLKSSLYFMLIFLLPLLYVYREMLSEILQLAVFKFFYRLQNYFHFFLLLRRRVLLYLTEIIRFFFFFSLTDMCLLQHNKLVLDLSFFLSLCFTIKFLFLLRDILFFPSSKNIIQIIIMHTCGSWRLI